VKKEKYNIAVAGATGMVGKEIIKILEERKFPVGELHLLASTRSAGSEVWFNNKKIPVTVLDDETFEGIDIGLFSPGASVSKIFAPKAAAAGCVVVDNTSQFRMDADVPLVIPEVNPEDIALYPKKNIIANPNCSTIQMVTALKPIHDKFVIKRVVVATYQAVSGAGKDAMNELSDQVRSLFSMKTPETKVFARQIAFNCLPHIDVFLDDGSTKEEQKMVEETHKILDEKIKVTATAVRVPVFVGHSEAVNIETELPIGVEEVREVLRIRTDPTVENGINMWVVSDNLRKGAALNAVQIAEILIRDYL